MSWGSVISNRELSWELGEILYSVSVDLKQIDYQLFLQKGENKGFIWDQQGIAIRGLQPWRVPTGQGKESTFIEGERKLGGL